MIDIMSWERAKSEFSVTFDFSSLFTLAKVNSKHVGCRVVDVFLTSRIAWDTAERSKNIGDTSHNNISIQ